LKMLHKSIEQSGSGSGSSSCVSDISTDTKPESADESISEPPTKKSRPSIIAYKCVADSASSSNAVLLELKLSQYLPVTAINLYDFDANHKPNVFANAEYSSLRPLFSRIFSIPATSAYVERVFSQGSITMRPHRARMQDSLLEMLILLRCNA